MSPGSLVEEAWPGVLQPPTVANWPTAGGSAGGGAVSALSPGDAGCARCCALYTRGRHERLSVQPRDATVVQARCGADGAGCSAEALPEAWQIPECGWATLTPVRCGEECMGPGGAFRRVLSQQDLERRSAGSEAKAAGDRGSTFAGGGSGGGGADAEYPNPDEVLATDKGVNMSVEWYDFWSEQPPTFRKPLSITQLYRSVVTNVRVGVQDLLRVHVEGLAYRWMRCRGSDAASAHAIVWKELDKRDWRTEQVLNEKLIKLRQVANLTASIPRADERACFEAACTQECVDAALAPGAAGAALAPGACADPPECRLFSGQGVKLDGTPMGDASSLEVHDTPCGRALLRRFPDVRRFLTEAARLGMAGPLEASVGFAGALAADHKRTQAQAALLPDGDLSGGFMSPDLARELIARQNTDGSWASLPRPMQTGLIDGEALASPAQPNGARHDPAELRAAELRTRVAIAVLETWTPPQWGLRVDMPVLLGYGWLHRLEEQQLREGVLAPCAADGDAPDAVQAGPKAAGTPPVGATSPPPAAGAKPPSPEGGGGDAPPEKCRPRVVRLLQQEGALAIQSCATSNAADYEPLSSSLDEADDTLDRLGRCLQRLVPSKEMSWSCNLETSRRSMGGSTVSSAPWVFSGYAAFEPQVAQPGENTEQRERPTSRRDEPKWWYESLLEREIEVVIPIGDGVLDDDIVSSVEYDQNAHPDGAPPTLTLGIRGGRLAFDAEPLWANVWPGRGHMCAEVAPGNERGPCWHYAHHGDQRVLKLRLYKEEAARPWTYLVASEGDAAARLTQGPREYRAHLLRGASGRVGGLLRVAELTRLLLELQKGFLALLSASAESSPLAMPFRAQDASIPAKKVLAPAQCAFEETWVQSDKGGSVGMIWVQPPRRRGGEPTEADGNVEPYVEAAAQVRAALRRMATELREKIYSWESRALGMLEGVRVLPPMVAPARGLTLSELGEEQEAMARDGLQIELQLRLGWQLAEKEQLKYILAEHGALMMPKCAQLSGPKAKLTCAKHCQWRLCTNVGGVAVAPACPGGGFVGAQRYSPWCDCCSDKWREWDSGLAELYRGALNGACLDGGAPGGPNTCRDGASTRCMSGLDLKETLGDAANQANFMATYLRMQRDGGPIMQAMSAPSLALLREERRKLQNQLLTLDTVEEMLLDDTKLREHNLPLLSTGKLKLFPYSAEYAASGGGAEGAAAPTAAAAAAAAAAVQECGAPNAPGGVYGREEDQWQWWDDGARKAWQPFEWAAQTTIAELHTLWTEERKQEGAYGLPPQGVAGDPDGQPIPKRVLLDACTLSPAENGLGVLQGDASCSEHAAVGDEGVRCGSGSGGARDQPPCAAARASDPRTASCGAAARAGCVGLQEQPAAAEVFLAKQSTDTVQGLTSGPGALWETVQANCGGYTARQGALVCSTPLQLYAHEVDFERLAARRVWHAALDASGESVIRYPGVDGAPGDAFSVDKERTQLGGRWANELCEPRQLALQGGMRQRGPAATPTPQPQPQRLYQLDATSCGLPYHGVYQILPSAASMEEGPGGGSEQAEVDPPLTRCCALDDRDSAVCESLEESECLTPDDEGKPAATTGRPVACFVAASSHRGEKKVQCRVPRTTAEFAGSGMLVAPVAMEKELRWVAAQSDNVGLCGVDPIPYAYYSEHQASVQRWCCARGAEGTPFQERLVPVCCSLPLRFHSEEERLRTQCDASNGGKFCRPWEEWPKASDPERHSADEGNARGNAFPPGFVPGMPERLRLLLQLPWDSIELDAPRKKSKCDSLQEWVKSTSLDEFERTKASPPAEGDGGYETEEVSGKLKAGLRRAWFCQLTTRCRELIESRSGVPAKTPPLSCLDKKRAMKVTLDKCPEGSETPCFGPYAQNVQDYQGFRATREVPLEVQSLERETSHAIEMEASLGRAARAARARNASSAAANGSAAAGSSSAGVDDVDGDADLERDAPASDDDECNYECPDDPEERERQQCPADPVLRACMATADARNWEAFPWWPARVQPVPHGRAEPKLPVRWPAMARLPWLTHHMHDGDECTVQNGKPVKCQDRFDLACPSTSIHCIGCWAKKVELRYFEVGKRLAAILDGVDDADVAEARARLTAAMLEVREMHDQVRGAILGLISCMRHRLRRMLAANNLGEFLHPARHSAAMDFSSSPEPWIDLGPSDEARRKWRDVYRHPPYCNRDAAACHAERKEAAATPPPTADEGEEGEKGEEGEEGEAAPLPAGEAVLPLRAEVELPEEPRDTTRGKAPRGKNRKQKLQTAGKLPAPDAPTEDCGEDCVANAREEQDLLHRLRRDQRIHLGMFNQEGRNPEMHPKEDDAGGSQLENVLTQSGFPATESGPFGPAKYLTGFGENERNTAPLSALSSCWCDSKFERKPVMDYYTYYYQHAYLMRRCQHESCFVCNELLAGYSYDELRGAAATQSAADVCYQIVGKSRMQVQWRKCWEILSAVQRHLPAVMNAVVHERAVAWDARKDAELKQALPLQEDIRNQAGYLVCRRLSCC